MSIRIISVAVVIFGSAMADAVFVQHPAVPVGMTHEEHLEQMQKDADLKRRRDAAMGFDLDQITHRFGLTPTGGAIEVEANDPTDAVSREQIRVHLRAIATGFASGVFDAPVATHDEVPTGVAVLQRLKALVTYSYEEAPSGARVSIRTTNREAREAIHEFLRYQIREHRTGDPLTIGE
jgi:hypothetical protein